jgi:hypothetical protein
MIHYCVKRRLFLRFLHDFFRNSSHGITNHTSTHALSLKGCRSISDISSKLPLTKTKLTKTADAVRRSKPIAVRSMSDRSLKANYEFASSNTTRTTFAFDVCFIWKLAPLADELIGFFIENVSRRLTRSNTY